jgi:Raf kinase inhibitor-like YbhB/YbcL family protein
LKKNRIQPITVLLGIIFTCSFGVVIEDSRAGQPSQKGKKQQGAASMKIESSSFPNNGPIPARLTCDGHDISPGLFWADVPKGTRSLVLIIDDPDAPDPAAPQRTWVHWLLYNISPDALGLPEGVEPRALPSGTLEGVNDWNRTGYGGPCPPIGDHRYFHKLYALDVVLPDLKHPAKAELEKAMQGHVIGHSELIGRYQKQ